MNRELKNFVLISILCGGLISSCRPGPTIPPIPVPPETQVLRGTVRDAVSLDGVFDAVVKATPDNSSSSYDCPVDPASARFVCVFPEAESDHGDILITAEGYQLYSAHVELVGELPDVYLQPNAPPTPILSRVVVRTPSFLGLADGSRWTVVAASDFNLLGRFAAGESIEPVLAQRESLGFNEVRVFTAYDIGIGSAQPIGRLVPAEHPGFYSTIVPAFADALARHHLYAELVAFTGPYVPGLNFQEHWAGLCGAAQAKPNLLLERVNEYDNDPNAGAPEVPACAGVVASNGSATEDNIPYRPVFEYATYHPGAGLSGEWQRRVGHDAMDMSNLLGVPVVANELIRFDDHETNCTRAYEAARATTLLAAGATYHSIAGKNSVLWTGVQLQCAAAWAQGANSMPLDCQDGGYWNNIGAATGDVIREYHRGADPRCTAVIHK